MSGWRRRPPLSQRRSQRWPPGWQLSRTESQGKGTRCGGRGHDKVHPLQSSGATERETWLSWSDKSMVSWVWWDAPARDAPSALKGNWERALCSTRATRAECLLYDGAYESSAFLALVPYARIVSALEGSNEHIVRHEEVRRIVSRKSARAETCAPDAGQDGHLGEHEEMR